MRVNARGAALSGLALIAALSPATGDAVRPAEIRIIRPSGRPDYQPVIPERRIAQEVERFIGESCDPDAVRETLARRYRFLGYVPEIEATCENGNLHVSIRESSYQIELITFDPGDLAEIGVRQHEDAEPEPRRLYPVPPGRERAVVLGLLQTREGNLYNFERYRTDSEALRALGFVIAFIPGQDRGPDAYPAGAYLIQSVTRRSSGERDDHRDKNYLGGTAEFGPRSGASSGLVYQRYDLLGRLDRLTASPNYNAALGGQLAYSAPFLIDRTEPKRLYEFDVGLFTQVAHNRLLAGVERDERRSGASLALGIRPLGVAAPHQLRWRVAVRHERVDLDRTLPGEVEDRLTFLRFEANDAWLHTFRPPSLSLRVVPAVDFALDAAGGRRTFVRPEIDARLHARYLSGLECDLHWVAGSVDRQVPAFELWSLGGATTVRGFREDSFLGRHLVSQQIELWIPFARTLEARPLPPGGASADPVDVPIEPRAARRLKAALFVDAGYVSGTADGLNPALLGAGVGLRFVVPRHPLVIRIDYGFGLGGRGGDSFPYVSLGYRF